MNTTTSRPGFEPTKGRRAQKLLYVAATAVLLALPAATAAAELPAAPVPAAPFPAVTGSSVEREPVAPGVVRATYRLLTTSGPVVASIVMIDPKEPTVRLAAVLAHDTIVSKDEPVSAMARRTGAVAGINADYFDVNGTGAPVGVLVRDGRLDRSPSARIALTVTRDRSVRFEPYGFTGAVDFGPVHVPLTAVNTWPPDAGATLLTAAFAAAPPSAAGVTVVEIAPLADTAAARRYRVASVAPAPPFPAGPALRIAYGPAAQAFGNLPDVGDVVTLTYDTDPPLAAVAAAVGGGPLLLRAGAPVDDPASPNYAERDRRIPAAAAARFADGTLGLIVVDGRRPATSIGLNRAELIAFLQALGATDAMLFDSGGSATLVARVLGDATPSVVNEPSDGTERPVADGLLVYSDAPVGPAARLVVRPGNVVALAGARVALRTRLVDAADHGLGDARGPWRIDVPPDVAAIGDDDVLQVGSRPGVYAVHVARGGVTATLPLEIVDRVARLAIGPAHADPDPRTTLQLTLDAFDARDRPIVLGSAVRWTATAATIDARGRLTTGDRDATVTASAGGIQATATIPVGRHAVPLTLFDAAHAAAWKFVTLPANGGGSVQVGGDRLNLAYDFTAGGRAAYATAAADVPLGEAVALSCAVDGDGGGAALRATLIDRYGERQAVTFARTLDFRDTRRLTAIVPRSFAPPVALRAIYVVGTLAAAPVTAAGTLGVHDCTASVPGTQVP